MKTTVRSAWFRYLACYLLLLTALSHAQTATVQRHIALEGAPNFRDLGGYATTDGKHVRWKKLYRTGQLSQLTAKDYEILNGLGIAVVCDFRRDDERSAAQTAWKGGTPPVIMNLPALQGVTGPSPAVEPPPNVSNSLFASYQGYPTNLGPSYRTVLRQIMERDGAVVYHCTFGKDRTGTFSALLLTMLGVPRSTIMEDYLLSNEYVATPERVAASVARGTSPQAAVATIGVDKSYLEVMFASIDRGFGSFDEYRRRVLGVSDADLAVLKAKLLE